MKKTIKIIIIILILILFLIILGVYQSGNMSLFNGFMNKIVAGTPDGSCYVDTDCKIVATDCGICTCGQAVNKNWQVYCPFKKQVARECEVCPPVQAVCRNYACRTEPIIPPRPTVSLISTAELLAQIKNNAELKETGPVEKILPPGILANQIQKYFQLGDLYLALVL